MPFSLFPAGRIRLLSLAGCACLLGGGVAAHSAVYQRGGAPSSPFEHAQRLREALEGRPEAQRTRRQYDHVLEAYRALYHNAPGSPKADASVSAVADLLAEEGRVFQDEKALHDAIGQYEFLRSQYPASRFRFSALLTEGEIYERDLNDPAQAKAAYQQFLRLYPRNPLAAEARIELKNLHHDEIAGRHGQPSRKKPAPATPETVAAPAPVSGASHSRRSTVLTAAVNSQQAAATTRTPSSVPPATSAPAQPTRARQGGMQESDIVPAPAPVAPAQAPPAELAHMTDAELNAPPPPRNGKTPLVTGIRYWSTPVYTRVAIDLQDEVRYQAARVPSPDRIFFDLYGTRLSPELIGKSVQVTDDGFLSRIRAAQFSNDVSRVVLDVANVSEYSAFFLPNPPRLIIDVHGEARGSKRPAPPLQANANPPKPAANAPAAPATRTPAPTLGLGPASTPAWQTAQSQPPVVTTTRPPAVTTPHPPSVATSRPPARSTTRVAKATPPPSTTTVVDDGDDDDASSLADVASLSRQPDAVKATKHPTRGPVAASVPGTKEGAQTDSSLEATNTPPPMPSRSTRTNESAPPVDAGATGIHAPEPLAGGQRSMMRALGLKINRIVIDAGHGGHDSGTLGPGGIEEKDVVLDVALKLGKLLKQRLGADVIYTRDDDTFIPLETRTAIANKAQADLFISIHANSSPDADARGVETYYLNFTSSTDALEVAARENAVSDESIHQLSDLVKKIALQDKINESREFASDVEQDLYTGLESGNPGLKDRGVKKAPFVVLIGANMPSILAEISFLTNPDDAQELRESAYRERIAESLYRGVAKYVGSLNGVHVAENKP
jgi:N-acetylmuramoyl-L-alanine amidase